MRWFVLLLGIVMLATLIGCGSDKDHGLYKDKDRPRATDRGK
jgi:hypothetical protein